MNYIALLRGAPTTMFLALLKCNGQATTGKLCTMTGYSKPTVIAACRALINAGLATNNVMGWILMEGSPQMVLGESYPQVLAVSYPQGKDSLPDVVGINVVNSESSLKSLTTGKVSLLREVGISEPMRTRLAELAHCTEEYLSAHIAEWRKNPSLGVGILINRLRDNDPAPEDKSDPRRYVEGEFSEFIEH